MNFDQLRTFVTAAENLNFTHTARIINLTQSAVSQQIRELEEGLGVSLFERRGRSIALTTAGERLRPLALEILGGVRRAQNELAAFSGVSQGVLQLGTENTPGIYLLPHALDAFARRMPGVKVNLRICEPEILLSALQDGELDLALLEDEVPPGRLHGWDRLPLIEDEIVLITAPDHRWTTRQEVELTDLVGEPFILRPRDSGVRRLHSAHMAALGLNPDVIVPRFELGHTEGIKRAVMASLGVGFVSRYAITSELAAGMLAEVRVRGLTMGRSLWLLKPAQRKLSVHQQAFVELLLESDWIPPTLRQSLHAERGVRIVEVRVRNPKLDGLAIRAVGIPRSCLVALLKRSGSVSVPDGNAILSLDDTVTLIGLPEVVEEVKMLLEWDRPTLNNKL